MARLHILSPLTLLVAVLDSSTIHRYFVDLSNDPLLDSGIIIGWGMPKAWKVGGSAVAEAGEKNENNLAEVLLLCDFLTFFGLD